jgi:putative acyl-CoA dehydrogenase
MRNVLADLALESEAALALTLRLGRAIDESAENEQAAAFTRIVTAVGKYWICKRTPAHCVEALECLGGPGYIEDSIMPRLYREAPLNSIWEGSGNIMCLDVLRSMFRETAAIPAILTELESVRGENSQLDAAIDRLATELGDPESLETRARQLTELIALTLQAALLVEHAPAAVSDAFCATRLGSHWLGSYGTLPAGTDFNSILERALPIG